MKNYFGSRIKTPATLSPWHICAACALLLILACGVQVKQQSLYDGRQPNPRPDGPERIELAVEPLVFSEDDTNFWVADDTSCTTGYVTTETAHSGDRSLRINWNRDPAKCEWAGFGIGWDDWAGKDLSEIYDKAAIEMYVRSKEGKMFGLPVVLTLEDYSGHMAWSYTTNKYFERYYIDEEWQRVVVPLNTFDLEEDGLDLTNIKQLNFELQQSGAAFFDDISIVFYDPPAPQVYLPNEPVPPTDVFPITLFNDQFVKDGGWGVFSDKC